MALGDRGGAARGEKVGGFAGAGLLWKGGGVERSVEGLQGLVCHCHLF